MVEQFQDHWTLWWTSHGTGKSPKLFTFEIFAFQTDWSGAALDNELVIQETSLVLALCL